MNEQTRQHFRNVAKKQREAQANAFSGKHKTPLIESPRSGKNPLRRLHMCWQCDRLTPRLNYCVHCGNFLFIQPGPHGGSSPIGPQRQADFSKMPTESLFLMSPESCVSQIEVPALPTIPESDAKASPDSASESPPG
jgi:hypothetical protein